MDIKLIFTVIECKNGHMNEYFSEKCKICGESLSDNTCLSDPNVDYRVSFLKPLFEIIDSRKKRIKNIRKEIDNGKLIKSECSDCFSLLKEAFSKLCTFSESELFNCIELDKDNPDSKRSEKWLEDICSIFSDAYDYLEKLLITETKTIWKNAIKRITKLTSKTIDAFSHMLSSSIALTYEDAQKIQSVAQSNIDDCSMELKLISDILYTIKNSDTIDIFMDGKINYSALMVSLICGNNKENINDTLKTVCNNTYYYFKNVLKNDIDYYSDAELLSLSGFKQVGLSIFDDEKYFRKIQIALNLINQAFSKNSTLFKSFFDKYQDIFSFYWRKSMDLNIQFAFVFGHNPSDLVIMHNLINWYKTVCEGIYRDASKLLYFCIDIINKEETDISSILEWVGYGDIVGRFLSQRNKKFILLTEGIDNIIRNSEAHVTYEIDEKNEKITLRNKRKQEKTIETKEYGFLSFLETTCLLFETTFSIIAATYIFILNNKQDNKRYLESVLNQSNDFDISVSELIFAFKGVVITNREELEIENKKQLRYYGKYLIEINKDEIERVISVFYPIIINKPEYDSLMLILFDNNNNKLCSIKVITKYYKEYKENENNEDIKKYILFIAMKTTEIYYEGEKEVIDYDKKDYEFLFGVLKLFLPRIKECTEKKEALFLDYRTNIGTFKDALEEVGYVIYSLNEYLGYCYDKRIINYVLEIMQSIENAVEIIIKNNRISRVTYFMFNKIGNEMKKIAEVSKLFLKDIEKEEFLQKNIKEDVDKRLGRNSPCPCGSGLKYKKCCGKD